MKIAFFTDMLENIHLINLLQERGLLGIVLTPESGAQSKLFTEELAKSGILFHVVDQKDLTELPELFHRHQIDCGLLFFFPYLLPGVILDCLPLGFYNLHPALLPKYRGGDPLFWQIKEGEEYAGVTLHRLDSGMDTGPIVDSFAFPIRDDDTHNTLRNSIVYTGYKMLEDIESLLKKESVAQIDGKFPKASLPTMDDYTIQWESMNAEEIERLCRASNPTYGGARAYYQGEMLGIMQCTRSDREGNGSPGEIMRIDEREGIVVALKEGSIAIECIYTEDGFFTGGRYAKRFGMKIGNFLRIPA